MRSLQARLGSGLILSLIAIFSVLWLVTSISVHYLAQEYIASRLGHDAQMLLSAIRFDPNGTPQLDEKLVDLVYLKPFSGHYYSVDTAGKTLRSRSLWDWPLAVAGVKPGDITGNRQKGPDRQWLLVMSYGFVKQAKPLTVTVAEDLNPVNRNIRRFQFYFAATALTMLLSLVGLQVYILRASLRTLSRTRQELQALRQGEIAHLTADVPGELQPLVYEINHLLDIMDQRVRRSRDALGDLAHAIKKPLTVLQQWTGRHGANLPAEGTDILKKQVFEINRITERILKRARLAGPQHGGARFSFAQDLPELIKTLSMMYGDKSIDTQIHIPEKIQCPIEREDMLELLGNLLDNAYKWARQKIRITVAADSDDVQDVLMSRSPWRGGSDLILQVEDDGPGADADRLHYIDIRGVRLDESRQGHGLGLAIVADIVRDYHGRLVFGQSERLGGFKVEVTLPLDAEKTPA